MNDKSRDKVRICHISEATVGGVFTHLIQLATNLGPEYEQTFVLSSIKNPGLIQLEDFYGHRLKIIDMARDIKPFADMSSIFKLVTFLRHNKFDIIHCHSSKGGAIGRIAALTQPRAKVVYTPHCFAIHDFNSRFKNMIYAALERMLAGITDKVICVSDGERKLGLEKRIFNHNTSVVIPNGISIQPVNLEKAGHRKSFYLKQWFNVNDGLLVGFVGRMSEQKNPRHLLEAISRLRDPKIFTVFIGDGELLNECSVLAGELGISDRVHFTGHVDNAQDFMPIMDVFISTSLWESMPYSILEAMASAVPVVATNITGTNDIINNGNNGILIEPNDVDELSEQLDELSEDTDFRTYLGAQAKQTIIERYSLDRMVKKTRRLYSEILNK